MAKLFVMGGAGFIASPVVVDQFVERGFEKDRIV